jgi:hypothetical protein
MRALLEKQYAMRAAAHQGEGEATILAARRRNHYNQGESEPERRYRIRVTEQAAKETPTTILDPPASVWLADRDSAEELCRRLNSKLGYNRFVVEEM